MENPTSVAVFLPVRVPNSLPSKALNKTSQKYAEKLGITLLEVLVSLVILSLIVTGLFNTFISGKKFILHSRARMASAEMSRIFLDYLQMYVRAYDWDSASNALTPGNYYCDGTHAPAIQGCAAILPFTTLDNDLSASGSGDITFGAYKIEYGSGSVTPGYTISSIGNLRKVKLTISWNETPIY